MKPVNGASVAIVGGGPVGLMLALMLDRHHVPSVVFDTAGATRMHPKGSTHNARTMEHYRRVGVAGAVRTLGLPPEHPRDVAYFTRLCGFELARIALPSERQSLAAAQAAPADDQVPEPLLRANQMYVDRQLFQHASDRPGISLRFGRRVTGFVQDAAGVEIDSIDAGGSQAERWRANYLIGCDGGQSFVRRALGIAYQDVLPSLDGGAAPGQGFLNGRMFSSHVRIPALPGIVAGREAWMYNMLNTNGRTLLISLDGRDEFLLMSKADTDAALPADDEIVRCIRQGVGAPVDVTVLAHAAWYGGAALVAERFAAGRVLLAGDATHLFSPTGGFGMNTGIDGAANLAWKLAAAVQGWAGDGLLASYETERRPVALRNTTAARRLTERVVDLHIPAAIEDDGDAGALARVQLGDRLGDFRGQFTALGVELGARYDGSPLVWPDGEPPPDDLFAYRASDVPGGRLPHLWIDGDGPVRRSLFDLLGTGFTLLRIGPHAASGAPFLEAAARLDIPLDVLAITPAPGLNPFRKALVLVRPDQHVAWRGDSIPDSAEAVLRRAVGGAD